MKDQINQKKTFILVVILIAVAAMSRLLPHPVNFTAVGGMALFSGFLFKRKAWSFLLPVTVLFLTDLILGFHFSMLPVYACMAFTVWLGTKLNGETKMIRIGFYSVLSSTAFFLVTNLPFWYADLSLYPLTVQGTLDSYTLAIPFYKNQLAGDLIYTAAFFGVYSLFTKTERSSAMEAIKK